MQNTQLNKKQTNKKVEQHQSSSRLTLMMQRSFNGQTLSCVAENAKIAQSSIRQAIKLDVHCKYKK